MGIVCGPPTHPLRPLLPVLRLSLGPSLCRVEAIHQTLLTLWHQLHVDMKSLLAWQYVQRHIQQIQAWSLLSVSAAGHPPLSSVACLVLWRAKSET